MDDTNGWTAKVGAILPSNNTVIEPWFYHVTPPGVTFHFARMTLGKGEGLEAIKRMSDDSLSAARQLATIPVDVIAYCCTASTLIMGPHHDKELVTRLDSETGIRSTTTTISILNALNSLKIRKLSIISPYTHDIEELEVKYFSECGYEVLDAKGMNLSVHELDKPSPEEIYHFAKRGFDDRADCLLISCLNFRAQACIQPLEDELRKPVVTSAQAVLWNVLQMLEINEHLDRYGQLLRCSTREK